MTPAPTVLHCLLGAPDLSAAYRRAGLDADDLCRVRRAPVLEKRADWRVSRALKRQADAPVLSLSHSGGFAALLCADTPVQSGVDLERLRPRDFQALAQWVCTGEERAFFTPPQLERGRFLPPVVRQRGFAQSGGFVVSGRHGIGRLLF